MAHLGQVHTGQVFTKLDADRINKDSIEEEGISTGFVKKRFVYFWQETKSGAVLLVKRRLPISELKNDDDIYFLPKVK